MTSEQARPTGFGADGATFVPLSSGWTLDKGDAIALIAGGQSPPGKSIKGLAWTDGHRASFFSKN
jgi:hypothetical protein